MHALCHKPAGTEPDSFGCEYDSIICDPKIIAIVKLHVKLFEKNAFHISIDFNHPSPPPYRPQMQRHPSRTVHHRYAVLQRHAALNRGNAPRIVYPPQTNIASRNKPGLKRTFIF